MTSLHDAEQIPVLSFREKQLVSRLPTRHSMGSCFAPSFLLCFSYVLQQMVTAMAVMATAAVAAMATAMAATATTTAAVATMVTAIVAMGTAMAAVVAMATAMAATMAAKLTAVAGMKTTVATVMVGDADNNQLKGAAEETSAAAMVGGGQQRHARLGGGLQWGRDDGGKRCRRQLSGNDGCNGGRPQQRTRMAKADDDGGG